MSIHTLSLRKIRRIVRQHGSAMLGGATGALCFSLVAMGIAPTLSAALHAPSRTIIAQEWQGGADPNQGWGDAQRAEQWIQDEQKQEAEQRKQNKQQYADLGRWIQDNKSQIKNMKGEVKRLKKDLKEHPDLAKLEAYAKEFETELTSVVAAYKTMNPDDTDAIQDVQSNLPSSSDFYDLSQDLNDVANQARQAKESQRTIKHQGRVVKDMTRECKRVKCAGTDLEGILKAFKAAVDTMKSAIAAKDFDAFADASSEADELNQEFWPALEEYNQKSNLGRDIKDLEKNLKDVNRMEKDVDRRATTGTVNAATLSAIKDVISTLRSAAQDARTAYNAGDYEGAQDAVNRTRDAFNDLDRLRNDLENGRGDDEDLDGILGDIGRGEKNISDTLKKGTTSKETAAFCRGLFSQGREIIAKHKATPSEALMEQLEGIGDKVGASCWQFMDR